jgi:hypothetical protein
MDVVSSSVVADGKEQKKRNGLRLKKNIDLRFWFNVAKP